nr:MAG TPA: hypothetical protein [Caudoviricetes sp.]
MNFLLKCKLQVIIPRNKRLSDKYVFMVLVKA